MITKFNRYEHYPKWFYLVLRTPPLYEKGDLFLENLIKKELTGLKGISDNADIVRRWFDIRDMMIIMPGEKVLNLNSLEPVKYNDEEYLIKDNAKTLLRLVDSNRVSFVYEKLFQRFQGENIYGFNKDLEDLKDFLNRNHYKISEDLENVSINTFDDLVNNSYDIIKNKLKKETWSNVPYGSKVYDINNLKKENLRKFLKKSILDLGKVFVNEGEWIVKSSTFKIPDDSVLFVKEKFYENNKENVDKIPLKLNVIKYPKKSDWTNDGWKSAGRVVKKSYSNT